jgi:hypothetical protein
VNPESFRELKIEPGTLLGFIGDYNAPSRWSRGKQVKGVLASYWVVEQDYTLGTDRGVFKWDAAVLVSLDAPLETVHIGNEECTVSELLLIQRYPDLPWDGKPPGDTVFMFGVRVGETLNLVKGALSFAEWHEKTEQLSLAAIMTVLETPTD